MLSDFESIKEDLSIVNGSFFTMRKPLKFFGKSIHIRDTMLLAPAGCRRLAQIGILYGEGFNNLFLIQEDLNNLRGF